MKLIKWLRANEQGIKRSAAL